MGHASGPSARRVRAAAPMRRRRASRRPRASAHLLNMLVGISCPGTSNNCVDSLAVQETCQGPRLPGAADNTRADLRGQTALCVPRQRRSHEGLGGADLTGSAWAPSPDRGTATLADMSDVTYTGADGIGRQAAGLAAWRGEDPAVLRRGRCWRSVSGACAPTIRQRARRSDDGQGDAEAA